MHSIGHRLVLFTKVGKINVKCLIKATNSTIYDHWCAQCIKLLLWTKLVIIDGKSFIWLDMTWESLSVVVGVVHWLINYFTSHLVIMKVWNGHSLFNCEIEFIRLYRCQFASCESERWKYCIIAEWKWGKKNEYFEEKQTCVQNHLISAFLSLICNCCHLIKLQTPIESRLICWTQWCWLHKKTRLNQHLYVSFLTWKEILCVYSDLKIAAFIIYTLHWHAIYTHSKWFQMYFDLLLFCELFFLFSLLFIPTMFASCSVCCLFFLLSNKKKYTYIFARLLIFMQSSCFVYFRTIRQFEYCIETFCVKRN